MIPARGYSAQFRIVSDGGNERVVGGLAGDSQNTCEVPVVAWSDDGQALVVDRKGGGLRVAATVAGFVRLVHKTEVTIVPGGGWMGDFDDDITRTTMPVVAWRIEDDGDGRPLFTIDTGDVAADGCVRVWHPAQYPGGRSKVNFKD